MILEQSEHVIQEVKKAFMGKDDIIRRVLATIYAGGHILLEDSPGVGKTTLALAFSRVLGLDYKRIQFTTDTLPSDITGFTMYNRQNEQFEYHEGAAMCNLLLADEINRTSPKTQSRSSGSHGRAEGNSRWCNKTFTYSIYLYCYPEPFRYNRNPGTSKFPVRPF